MFFLLKNVASNLQMKVFKEIKRTLPQLNSLTGFAAMA